MVRSLWKMPILDLHEQFTPRGRTRELEPMLMDAPESVAQFHHGGATSSGMLAVHDLSARCLNMLVPEGGRLLDLGCGSGRALTYFAKRRSDIRATGVDLAPNMLAQARQLMEEEGIADRVRLIGANIAALPDEVLDAPWDAVSCVWTLHHLPDEATLDAVLRQITALRERHGCAVWIMDFQRLKNARAFPQGLRISEPRLDDRLSEDAIASEAAAFTYAELTSATRRGGNCRWKGRLGWMPRCRGLGLVGCRCSAGMARRRLGRDTSTGWFLALEGVCSDGRPAALHDHCRSRPIARRRPLQGSDVDRQRRASGGQRGDASTWSPSVAHLAAGFARRRSAGSCAAETHAPIQAAQVLFRNGVLLMTPPRAA